MKQPALTRCFRPGLRIWAIIGAVAALVTAEGRGADYDMEVYAEEWQLLDDTVRDGHDGCVVRLAGRFDFEEFVERNPVTWEMEYYMMSEAGFHTGPFGYGGFAEWLRDNITIFHGSGREERYVPGTLFPVKGNLAEGRLEPNYKTSRGLVLPPRLPLEDLLWFELRSGEWEFCDLYWNFRGRWTQRTFIGREIARAERLAAAAAAGIDAATLEARSWKVTEELQIRQALVASLHQPSGANKVLSKEDAARLGALKNRGAGAASEDFVESSSFYKSPPVYFRGLRREQEGDRYGVYSEVVYDFMGRELAFTPYFNP